MQMDGRSFFGLEQDGMTPKNSLQYTTDIFLESQET